MIVCHDCKPLNVNVKSTIKDCLLSSAAASNLIATVCVLSVISWLQRRCPLISWLQLSWLHIVNGSLPRWWGWVQYDCHCVWSLTLLILHADSYGNIHQEYWNRPVWLFSCHWHRNWHAYDCWLCSMLTVSFPLGIISNVSKSFHLLLLSLISSVSPTPNVIDSVVQFVISHGFSFACWLFQQKHRGDKKKYAESKNKDQMSKINEHCRVQRHHLRLNSILLIHIHACSWSSYICHWWFPVCCGSSNILSIFLEARQPNNCDRSVVNSYLLVLFCCLFSIISYFADIEAQSPATK